MSEAKQEAVRAIIEFVKGPDMFQCDFLDMWVVVRLEKDGKCVGLPTVEELSHTDSDAYLAFHAANSTLLKSYGLVHEDCITKMRLMTLADLGSSNHGKISYVLRDTLHITDEEVEYWVVEAITAKVLDCKMDLMNQTVDVSRSTDRVFGLSQWKALKSELGIWRGNIANVINTIQANRISEESCCSHVDSDDYKVELLFFRDNILTEHKSLLRQCDLEENLRLTFQHLSPRMGFGSLWPGGFEDRYLILEQ